MVNNQVSVARVERQRNPGRVVRIVRSFPYFADARCGTTSLCPRGVTGASDRQRLGPARLAVGEIVAERDGGLRGRDLATAAAGLRQPEQVVQGAARAAMQIGRASCRERVER